ncbi:Outer membrane protein OmpA [Bacteroides luti]|uniref:Outer membrane protein OmpA n=1 Tax=Bacteroides luti TaxID=1297750 RepID=A0A1M4U5F5_9BACE|nr:OmpA family protein [Bacteroides luti]SHE51915.1 Outer membrane protein OmpA [Bacteroides luti]
MKKKVLILLFAIAPLGLFAQNTAHGQEKALKQYVFWDNWFIQGQFGAQRTYSEGNKSSSFGDKLSPTAALGVGKFFSPEVGARIQLGGWTSSNYLNGSTYDVKYLNGNIDALFNLTNIFLSYKENRVFNLIGILGAGYVHGFRNSDENLHATNSVAPRIGLQADFRLSNTWSINLEANGNLLRDDFNGQEKFGCSYDGTLNVLAGVTYRFGRRGFATVEAADPALIQSLNDQINSQRGQIEEYKACCEKKSEEPKTIIKEVPSTKSASLNSVVSFRIGKATIDPSQEVYVYNAAQYLKQNPDAKVVISSFADKNTGTAEFNQKLSEKRSEAVAKILKEKYGIAENRFTVENNGDKQQPYPDNNNWNRISIITSK